jgi:putative tricarboxylic transport membrane protein
MDAVIGRLARTGLFLAIALGAMWHQSVLGQQPYPAKGIDIIVPFAAGGSTDLTARVFAKALQDKWRVQVRVVNQTGGNGLPAISAVMQARPDAYTVLMDGTSSSSALPLVVDNLPFKVEDRTFISLTSQTPMVYLVAGNSPHRTLGDVIARIKKDPATFTWTSNGGVTAGDAAGRQLIRAAGVTVADTRPVIARGGAEGAVQAAGGHVELSIASYISVVPFLDSGKLRPLAVAAAERFAAMPNVPTTAEAGFPAIQLIQWNGFSGPPALPAETVEIWRVAVQQLLKEPQTIKALAQVGLEPRAGDGKAMAEVVAAEQRLYATLFR